MKFKVVKGHPLFDKLEKVWEDMNMVNNKANEMCRIVRAEILGVSDTGGYCRDPWALGGGIIGFVLPERRYNGWKKVLTKHYNNVYMPSSKNNAELLKKIKDLPKVEIDRLNVPLNYESDFGHPGFYCKDGIATIHISEKKTNYIPVDGMIEILESEYRLLMPKEEAEP